MATEVTAPMEGQTPVVSFLEIDGKVLSGEEFEEYCKDRGLCKRCARVRTHRRVLKLFGRGQKWEPLTVHDEESGEYTVYKGFCLQPTCYTLGQAKRLLGETGTGSSTRRKSGRRKRLSQRLRKRRPSRRLDSSGTGDTESTQTGDDDRSVSSRSVSSEASGASQSSVMSFTKRLTKRFSSAMSSASSVSSDDYSDDGTIDSTATPLPYTVEDGQPSPIVQHRVEQLIIYDYFTVLDLSKVELREEDVGAIVSALKVAKTLESLILEKCKLKDDRFEKIAQGLAESENMKIQKLNARQNSIGNQGAMALSQLLQRCTALEELNLSENSISSRGAVAIISALEQNPNCVIKTLNLAQNEIWDLDDGNFLRSNSTLQVLNLDGNFMHDEGAESIAAAIAENPGSAIERLYLGWNGISDDGAEALAKMMEVNSTLQVLGLAENDISNTGARAILSALAVNTSVREISGLYHNQIDRKFIIVAIKRLLHRYGERNGAQVVQTQSEKQLNASYNGMDTANDGGEEKQPPPVDEDDDDDDDGPTGKDTDSQASESSLNWAAQLYSNEEEDANQHESVVSPPAQRSTSVALEAIEHWDWGTFGIEEIEAAGTTNEEKEAAPVVETKGPEDYMPHQTGELPVDKLTIFQSAPLAYFDRISSEHHAIPLLDYDSEARSLKMAMADADKIGARIDLEFETATTERLSSFFTTGGSSIVHLSCYGHSDYLVLENGFGYMQPLQVDDLRRFIRSGSGKVQAVLISAYHSDSMAESFLAAGIPHVICCHKDAMFRDDGVIEFVSKFYQLLAGNKTLKDAFRLAVDAVRVSPLVKNTRNLAEKFRLLPHREEGDPYHNVHIFFQSPLTPLQEQKNPDMSTLPPVPPQFVGREVDMYEILESLRVDDVIRVGGPPGSGKKSLLSAVSRYMLQRPKSFQINDIFWLPALPHVAPEQDTLYGDLCLMMQLLIDSEDDIWEDEEVTECRERILIELEGKRTILIMEGKHFTSEAAGENLERFLSHLLNEANVKIVLVSSSEKSTSKTRTSRRSRSEETTIHVGPLDFKSSALLFGSTSKYVSGDGCSATRTPEEFVSMLVPPSIAHHVGPIKNPSRRQTDLYERMGGGNPLDIVTTAIEMSESAFTDILRVARRPEVHVDSSGALESQILKRTSQREKAVTGKNYLRAADLNAIIEELEALRPDYPTLSDLQAKERSLKRELTGILAQRKYDEANKVKRKLLALKKVIMKEKSVQPSGENAPKYTAGGKLLELQAQMNNMLAMAEKMNMDRSLGELEASMKIEADQEAAEFTIYRGQFSCILNIYAGSVVNFSYSHGVSAIFCWTNESCDLNVDSVGKVVLNEGGANLAEDLNSLPPVANTKWGPIKCETGDATVVGPRNYSKLASRYVILAVSPLSPDNNDDDWDGDENRDEDALHYLDTGLRSAYRACFGHVKRKSLVAAAVPIISTKETGSTYERTLRVGLQTLVEECKFSNLAKVDVIASSKKEASVLVAMARGMGLTAS